MSILYPRKKRRIQHSGQTIRNCQRHKAHLSRMLTADYGDHEYSTDVESDNKHIIATIGERLASDGAIAKQNLTGTTFNMNTTRMCRSRNVETHFPPSNQSGTQAGGTKLDWQPSFSLEFVENGEDAQFLALTKNSPMPAVPHTWPTFQPSWEVDWNTSYYGNYGHYGQGYTLPISANINPPRRTIGSRNKCNSSHGNELCFPLPDSILSSLQVVRVHRRSNCVFEDSKDLVEVRPHEFTNAPTLLAHRNRRGEIQVDWTATSNYRAAAVIFDMWKEKMVKTSGCTKKIDWSTKLDDSMTQTTPTNHRNRSYVNNHKMLVTANGAKYIVSDT
ncbi:uncharacterized protein [Diadema setosum]|uniref:uncharacterized protein n=1 Tax=Diadema setosum TaxID=31175 RepID=UPI003B3AEB05